MTGTSAEKQWVPLESNPEILTNFAHALGLPNTLSFTDVWSLDLLDMVPYPRYAILLLFPISPNLRNAGSSSTFKVSEQKEKPFFCKQTISNACGTIALLHAVLNSNGIQLINDSFLDKFRIENIQSTPDQRASALQASPSLDAVHSQFAQQGQTAVPSDLDHVNMHFVCFVHTDGVLYLLDGRKDEPVAQCPTTEHTFLQDTAHVIQSSFMAVDPTEHRFTIVALTLSQD